MFKLFKPRQDQFLKLINDQAALTLKGTELLQEYMKSPDAETVKQITATEKEADEVRRILIEELNRTFITPIDREDIFALSRTIDDVLDYAYSTVIEMGILSVHPTPFSVREACSSINLRKLSGRGLNILNIGHSFRSKLANVHHARRGGSQTPESQTWEAAPLENL